MKLVYPDPKYFSSFEQTIAEYKAAGMTHYNFLRYDPQHYFENVSNARNGVGLKPGYVPCTFLWLIKDEQFAGEISIRHDLTDALMRYGGHIGYWMRSTCWNQGMGTQMLAMALEYVKAHFSFQRVLITCDDDNIGSARVIEKNGGILENKIINHLDDTTVLTRRYWITL